jgi:hypothetical protein
MCGRQSVADLDTNTPTELTVDGSRVDASGTRRASASYAAADPTSVARSGRANAGIVGFATTMTTMTAWARTGVNNSWDQPAVFSTKVQLYHEHSILRQQLRVL